MHDPIFDDGVFVPSWILFDLPFGPHGETALDYFEEFLGGTEAQAKLKPFFEAARTSRLGLHQDAGRTKKAAKFRELLSGRVTSVYPSIVEYGKGEILLARMMKYGDQVFVFGDPKGFPGRPLPGARRCERPRQDGLTERRQRHGTAGKAVTPGGALGAARRRRGHAESSPRLLPKTGRIMADGWVILEFLPVLGSKREDDPMPRRSMRGGSRMALARAGEHDRG
ncbi:MAG: hypothetical protein HY908_07000 [Myxococcales bacterium]|nr:hypothetical protein [Myxococcales bacterium]